MTGEQKKSQELPQQGEWPLTDKQKEEMRYGHAAAALRHLNKLKEHGYDVTGAFEEWEQNHGETYRKGLPSK